MNADMSVFSKKSTKVINNLLKLLTIFGFSLDITCMGKFSI